MAPVPEGDRDGPNRNEGEISDFNTPPVNLEVESGSSSSEEDDSPYSGYQLLAQDPDMAGDFSFSDCLICLQKFTDVM